jgi:hypothetical protein
MTDKNKLKEIEYLSSLQFSVDEIAISTGFNLIDFKKKIKNKKSKEYLSFQKGRLLTQAEVRKSILQMSKQGSTPAQKQMIELIQRGKDAFNDISIDHSKKLKEKADANIKIIELRKLKGELLDRHAITKTCQNVIVITKTKLLAMSTKLSPQLVGIGSIKKIKNMIDKEIYQALNELSRLEKIE